MQRRELLKVVAAAPAFGVSVRSALAQAPAARPIVFAQSTAITALDPAFGAFATYPSGYEAALCLYDRLVDFDARMNIVPQLAESWQLAPDLTSVTFRLRRGVKFHDGTEFNAAAVKINVERMMDRQRTPTNRPLWDPLAGVDAPDAQTVVVRMRAPFADILNTFAHGSAAVVSPSAIQRLGDREIARNPVGAGPYRLESFNPGQQLVLVAFDDYWAGKPRTPRITFNFVPEAATRIAALRTGAADVVDAVPVQLIAGLRREPGIEVSAVPGLRPMGFAINTTRAPFNDVRVRRALNLSVPVQQIAERVFFGFARAPDAPLAFNTNGYRKAGDLTFNVQQASALLAEAGWRERVNNVLTKDGQPLRLTWRSARLRKTRGARSGSRRGSSGSNAGHISM
jgi:ABC-type transport system substrate-binding protein